MVEFPVRMEGIAEKFPDLGGVFHEVLVLYHIQHCKCSRTCEVVTSECGAEHPVFGPYFRRDYHSSDREAVCHPLGGGDDVRPDA